MKANTCKRGKRSRRWYAQTIVKNNGIKRECNEKVVKTIIKDSYRD